MVTRADVPPVVLDMAVSHPSKRIRRMMAEVGGWGPERLSPEQWQRLLNATPEPGLRAEIIETAAQVAEWRENPRSGRGIAMPPMPEVRPPATPEEIAAMADAVPQIEPDGFTSALWWVGALFDNPDAMRQLARSSNLWIRRSVARAPHLPPDVVALLAHDPDRVVRLFLTESCDDAPADVLLEVCSWWDGSLSFPGRPRSHPNFPRHDLLRFAEDPNPRLRQVALDDPLSSADLVEQFSHDPDPIVRGAAARDNRLSTESVTRLTSDPDPAVRHQARQSPVLPPNALVRLLLDSATAEDAAANPSIPASVMNHMITLALRQLCRD